jgi:hypothetical protein
MMKKDKIKNIYKFIKEEKVIIILTFIYLLFRTFFENLINTIIVSPILSEINVNYFSDLIFLIAIGCIIFFYFSKRSKNLYIPNKITFIAVIILSLYIYYRFISSEWSYIGLKIYSSIKYLDTIPLFLISIILLKFFPKKKKERSNKNNSGFYLDNSLGKDGKDLLNREDLASFVN